MTTEICPCAAHKPVIGTFYGPKGLTGYKMPDVQVPACEDCVREFSLTIERQRTDEYV